MEATKNPKTDAQRDQHLAVCRHTHDNIIFNYGSIENYIAAKNTEINTAESKLQSYYDNPRKGKSRRVAIIAGLENTIFIMKNSLTNTLRDLEELDAATPAEAPQISTETAETVKLSAEAAKTEKTPKYSISERDGNVCVTFMRGVIRECAKRCGVSCKSAEWNTIAQAYNGIHSDMGMGLSFFFDGREDAVRFAELVCNGDISGYYKLYMDKIIAEGEARKKRIAEEYAEYDAAQAHFAECMANEDAETANVSAEGEKAGEMAGNTPERKITYFHYTPEQLKRYIIDVYEKYANGEWVLQPHKQIDTDAGLWDVVNGKIGWWTNWRREKFSEMNMDFNSPTCGRCCKINRTYQKDNFIVSNEKLLEFTINGNYYYIQKQTYSKGKHRWCYTIMDALGDFAVDDFSYTKRGIMQRFNKWWKKNATIIWQSPEFAPQSPGTPQTVGCAADTPKPRETARKRQNRAIGSTHRSGLGANGFAMLDNASATLAAMSVPRECSTAEAVCW